MSQRILVFESDAAFAREVKSSFERLGAHVDVVGDGEAGLKLAQGSKPDLILLSIELPGMNGFLVCKKIKKTVELENVPLVILSSEVDEETFEQHKKLKTRADEYIHKPIGFQDLLARVQRWVPTNGAASPDAGGDEDVIEIDDEFAVSDDEVVVMADEPSGTQPGAEAGSDAVADFADAAMDSLRGDDDVRAPVADHAAAAEPAQRMSIPQAAPSARDVAAPGRMSVSPDQGGANAAELERLKREFAVADQKVQAAEKRAAAAELRASGAEKTLDAAKKTGGVSSRELLDLREQLNRKDRELLDLRDQVTARDKQLIESSDKSIVIERELQDTRDKVSDLQRDLDKKNEAVVALTADKESSKKRLEDTKARMERGEGKVKELGVELDGIKAQQALELEELRASHAEAEAKLRAQGAATVQQVKEEHAALSAAQQKSHESELSDQRDEHAVAQKAAAERAAQDKQSGLDAQRVDLLAQAEATLAEAVGAHKAELAAALAAHENELRRTREQLEQKAGAEMAEQTSKHSQDMARVGKALSEAESRHASLEERYQETEAARSAADKDLRAVTGDRDQKVARVSELETELGQAKAKLEHDAAVLERVRKAMAIGLGLLEG